MKNITAIDIPEIKMMNIEVEKNEVLLIGQMAFEMIESRKIHMRDIGNFVYTCLQIYRQSQNDRTRT